MNQTKLDTIVTNLIDLKPSLYKNLFHPRQIKSFITPGSHFVLVILHKCGFLSMSEIGKKLCIPKPNVTAIIDKLISEDFVMRLPDNEDRRIINIQLTNKGIQILQEIENKIKNHLNEKISSLSEDDIDLLSSSLENVKTILQKIPNEEMKL